MTISLLILLATLLSWRVFFKLKLWTGFERKSGILFLSSLTQKKKHDFTQGRALSSSLGGGPPSCHFIFESCQLHFLYVGILCGPFFGKKHFSTAPEKIVSFLYPCTYSYLIFVYFFRTMTFFEADSFQPKWLFIHDNID